jgi:Zn ribbon nucleic-acid-binding protein
MTTEPLDAGEETVECLACGALRHVRLDSTRSFTECSVCGYSGWAKPREIDEHDRLGIRRALALQGARRLQH